MREVMMAMRLMRMTRMLKNRKRRKGPAFFHRHFWLGVLFVAFCFWAAWTMWQFQQPHPHPGYDQPYVTTPARRLP